MKHILKLDIPLLLPNIESSRDQCVELLNERIRGYRGIEEAHIDQKNGQAVFCLHYDPNLLSLERVKRIAEEAGAEVTKRYLHEILTLTGLDCTDCAMSIEHILGRVPGIITVSVNYAAEKMRVEYDSTLITHDEIVRRIQWMGYEVEDEKPKGWIRKNWELVLSLFAGFFLVTGFFGEKFLGLPRTIAIGAYILSYLAGGYDATRHGIKSVIHLRFDIDFLMVTAAVGAAVLGEWPEGAFLLFLFSTGHALEHYAMGRARRAINALGQITPKTARVKRDNSEFELPVEELQRGEVVVVMPGERIPIDGTIKEGSSSVDQSPITGESIPVEKGENDNVFAGTVNGEGTLEIKVTKLARDTTLARVIQMVEEAQTQKSPTQRFTEKFEQIFVPVILAFVALVIALPSLVGWLSWDVAFLRGMTILVSASPCALAIAIPSAILSGVAQAARNGVLIKGGVHLENLGRLDAIAFDKTGTITRGKPEVTDIISMKGTEGRELLRIAAAVENRTDHPLAQAVVRKARKSGLDLPEAGKLQSVTGRGVRAKVDRQTVLVGNLKLFEGEGKPVPEEVALKARELETEGKTTMIVRAGNDFLGVIALADQPRREAKATIERLRRLGIRFFIMLTGDNSRVAKTIAKDVGLTEQRADLLPDEKVSSIKEFLKKYGQVAMVGDGVNDAPAMTNASVGIAMGASGTDVALETADVALMADDLSTLPFVVALSRRTRRIIIQNMIISLGVIALLIPGSLFGIASIGVAIIFHEGSTLIVVANALRLLRFRKE